MTTAVVIVHWNGLADTLRCLASFAAVGGSLDLVVVDNGSTDGSTALLAERAPKFERHRLHIVYLTENTGFAGGANAGAAHAITLAGVDTLFFLNNDAHVAPDFLAPLLEALRMPRCGAAGSLVLFDDRRDTVWCCGGTLHFRENVTALAGFGRSRAALHTEPYVTDYIPGCALLVSVDKYQKLGGFDRDYFAYMEDVDFGMRLRSLGLVSIAVPASVVFHRPSSSSGGGYSRARKYANAVNSIRFLRRHGRASNWVAFCLFDVLGLPVAWIRECMRRGGDPAAVVAKARGIADGFRGRRVTAGSFA